MTSGSHYSRHVWKCGSDQARDEEGLFFPLLRALCLALPGNTRGSESTSQKCKLTSCRLCFSQDRIGIRRNGGAGFTMARWCQGWQMNVYININGEYLRPHQHRSKGRIAELKLIWSGSRNYLQQLLEYNSIVKWNITACWRLYTNAQRSIID